jgi:hypothetical protein
LNNISFQKELESWRDHFSERIPELTPEEFAAFNEYVGGVFLFYSALFDHSGASFSEKWRRILQALVLQDTREAIQQFATRVLATSNGRVRQKWVMELR